MKKDSIDTIKERDSGKTIKQPLVAIAVPSAKLLNKLNEIKTVLDFFQVLSEISIVAAHRSPKKTLRFIDELEHKGVSVIIAAGSGSAHLPGMIASLTTIPTIGVPLRGDTLDGMDSLLSIVQMPRGVPVGTMGINSGYNAGIFACQILALKYPYLKEKLRMHKKILEEEVENEDRQLSSKWKEPG